MLGSFTAAIWLIFLIFAIQHMRDVKNLSIQVLYLRIVAVAPVCATASTILSYYGAGELVEVTSSVLEGYVFIAFFSLVVTYGWQHGNVLDALDASPSKRMFSLKGCEFGFAHTTPLSFLNSLWWQTFQLSIIKPLVSAIKFHVTKRSVRIHGFNSMDDISVLKVALSIICLMSIGCASLALWRLYVILGSYETQGSEKGFMLKDLNPVKKFCVVKLLAFVSFINGVVFSHLIPEILSVPAIICLSQSEYCVVLFEAFILCCECMILVIPAVIYFQPTLIPQLKLDQNTGCCKNKGLSLLVHVFMPQNSHPEATLSSKVEPLRIEIK